MKQNLFLLILLLLLCLPLVDLFHPGLPITHDGVDHVARIANFSQSLHEGNIIPRWAGNLNWGYGHPILEFLYPLPSYIVSLFHQAGFSFIDSTKIVYGFGILFSGVCMYLWLSGFLNKKAAMIGGLLYVFAPYRFVELYVRGDIGENLAFVFIPLTLFFIHRLLEPHRNPRDTPAHQASSFQSPLKGEGKKTKKGVINLAGGTVSLACLILAHNAMALMFIPFIVFYCIYVICSSNEKKRMCINSCILILLGFGLSAFFWLPGFFEGKYTLRNIVTHGTYVKHFVSFSALLYGKWSYGGSGQFTTQLGVLHWLVFFLTPITVYFISLKRRKESLLISSLFIYTLIAIFLMLPVSNIVWSKIILLQNFQFPWRFLAIPVFTLSALGAFSASELFNRQMTLPGIPAFAGMTKKGGIDALIIGFIIVIILFLNKDYWHANGYLYKPDSFFSNVYDGTTDTGESAPIWSVRFMEHQPKAHMEIIDGNAHMKEISRTSTKHVYKVTVGTRVRLRENTIYFPGWEVLIDRKKRNIEFQDIKNRGLITFYAEPGMHVVSVIYKETRLRIIADIISLVSLTGIIFIVLLKSIYRRQLSHKPPQ